MLNKPKFSPSKEKWIKKFKPERLEGSPLKPNVSIQKRTVRRAEALTNKMVKEVEKELKVLFKKDSPSYFAEDASIASQSRILLNALIEKYTKVFATIGVDIIDDMVREVNTYTKSSVEASLKKIVGKNTINIKDLSAETKEILKASASEAASYIKSIPQQYFKDVQGYVYRSITSGEGLKDLVPNLQKLSGQTKRRTRLIALDQTKKVTASLNKARLQQNGIQKGIWKHSGGSLNPRRSHQEMDGKVFNLSEGLYDYEVKRKVQPAELPYCNCYMVPVVEF